ncbi:MAG: lysylphosphatidylglycerol synthase domain-containing protein [Alphaproteobacteria bacterium]
MKTLSWISLVGGLAVVALLVAWQGFGTVAGILGALGAGVVLLPLVWLPHVWLGAASWRLLFAAGRAPRLASAVWALWLGHSLGTLVPMATVGDEVVKARALMLRGVRGVDASASVVVDKTVQALSLLAWGLIGAVALVTLKAETVVVAAALGGLALLAGGIAGFVAIQRIGAFGFVARALARLSRSGNVSGLVDGARDVDAAIRALYDRPGRIALACGVRLAARGLLTAEVLLAAYLMGQPLGVVEALMLRSLATALRGAAFVVPNGLGVQEGGFIVLGALVGQPPEFMLALSLATRAREIIVAVPGLVAWQHAEGRALWDRLSSHPRR